MNDIFNTELEQNILGCFLLDNKAYYETMGKLKPDDFYDGVHRDIFEVMEKRFNKDQLVSPVVLKDALSGHEGLAELGGPAYLVRLAGSSISIFAIREHVRVLQEITRKRQLNQLLVDASEALHGEDITPEEVVGRIEASFISSETHGTDGTVSMLAAVSKAADLAASAHQSEGVVGVTSGLVDLDRMTGGLQGGELVLLGGRPSMGKTAVALSMALAAARKGHGVAVSSLEMTPDSLALRAIANETAIHGRGIAYTDAKRGSMTEDQAKVFFETCADDGTQPACRLAGADHDAALAARDRPPADRADGRRHHQGRRPLGQGRGAPVAHRREDRGEHGRDPPGVLAFRRLRGGGW